MTTFGLSYRRNTCRLSTLFAVLLLMADPQLLAGDAAPFGIPTRVPWTTSHVNGSPEPPSPFESQRVFPKLTFDRPLDVCFAPGVNRVFMAQQKGKFFSFPYAADDASVDHADLFFDLKEIKNLDKVPDCKGTDDSLALIFHPQFQKNHYCFIEYNLAYNKSARNHENGSRISRFTVTDTNPPRVDPASEVIVLQWLSGGHNGCALKFGLDGYLYISLGDAGDPNPPDPFNSGQDISDLLCSVLRIDVDHPANGLNYGIPADNPFVTLKGARPEVYAYGFRNPFRMNFDSKNGNLWLGDVGWELWESIDSVHSGGNYGWSIMEGPNPVHPDGKRGPTEISKPQAALFHSEAASITGGLVYRGTKFPELYGHYVFGDWQTNRLWAAKCIGEKEDALAPYKEIAQTDQRIVAFTEDPSHEMLILDHGGGGLYRLARNPNAGQPPSFPRMLSATGLFTSVKDQTPAPGVMPFSVNAAQWVDGATSERWVATPGDSKVEWGKGVWGDAKPAWPKDSVLVRTLSLELKAGDPSSRRRVETQLLHFDGKQWKGYTYKWNDAQTDADIIGGAGDEKVFSIPDATAPEGTLRQNWRYASRTQCMTCHNVWCDYALAFNQGQLDRVAKFAKPNGAPGETIDDNQVRAFKHIGLLVEPKGTPPKTLTDPYDEKAGLNARARSYLHINCSHCHRFGGGGAALFDLRIDQEPKDLKAIDERPVLGDFGLDGGKLICAGDPNASVFLFRTSKLGRGRMPQIGSEKVDEKGTQLLRLWIAEMQTAASNGPSIQLFNDKLDILLIPDADNIGYKLDTLLKSTSGALALLNAVESGKLPEPVRKMAIEIGIASPLENVHDLFRRFDPREQFVVRLGANVDQAKVLAQPGDATRGKRVFGTAEGGGKTVGACIRCHKINGQGLDFGPDLSHIGTKYTKAQLLENIVEPSKTIAEGFEMYRLTKTSGEVMTGLLVSKSDTEIVIKDTDKQTRIPAAEVKKFVKMPTSFMPENLLQDCTPQEAADLIEYLSTLK